MLPKPEPIAIAWKVEPGPLTKIEGHEWMHGATHRFTCTVPKGMAAIEPATANVDTWTNSANTPFTHADCAALRDEVRRTTLKPTASLLDAVLPKLFTIPGNWNWHAKETHPELMLTWPDPQPQLVKAAQLLMALRGTIAARANLGKLLNATGTYVVETGKNEPKRLDFNWDRALQAGREAVDELLGNAVELVDDPPSQPASGTRLNKLLLDKVFAGDPQGLGRLTELGFVSADGQDGHPFKDKVKGYSLDPVVSGAVHQAYNHVRFVLYLEWRTLHELCRKI